MAVIGSLVATLALDSGSFIRDLEQAGGSIDKVGRRMAGIGKNLSTFVSAPLIGFGALALKTAGEFEEGMNRVAAVSGATESELATLREEAKRLGANIEFGTFSARDAAEGMGFLAQAGFKTAEIIGAMPGTLQLASAAQIELGESADIVSNILTGYNKKVTDLTAVNDVLVKTFTSTNTNLTQLGEAMSYVGPVASAAGLQFEETAAAIGLLGNAGIQASTAGTTLRGAITQILNPSASAAETMAELGIQLTDTQGRMRPLVEILEQLAPHADDAGLFMELFGQRAGPGMAALVAQGSGALADFTTTLENSGGTAAQVAETQMQGFKAAMEGLTSSFEALQIAIAEAGLIEFIGDAVKQLAGLVEWLSEADPRILQFGVVLAGAAAAGGPLLILLGSAAIAIGALLTPVGAVVAAIVGAAGIIAAIIAFRNEIGAVLTNAINAVIDAFVNLKTRALQAVQELVNGVLNFFGSRLTAAFDQVKQSIDTMVGWFETAKATIVGNSIVPEMVDEIGGQFGQLDRNMVRPTRAAVADTTAEFEKLENAPVFDAQKVFVTPFSNAMSSIQSSFTSTFEEIFSGGIASFSDLADQIKKIFIRLAAEIASAMVIQPVLGAMGGMGPMGGMGGAAGGFGGMFGPVLAGGLGALGGNFLAPMLGLGKTGGMMGGGLGAAAGMAFGGPLGGLIGGLGGTLIGGGLGKLFASRPSNREAGLTLGRRGALSEFGDASDATRQAVTQVGNSITQLLQGIEATTGRRFGERIKIGMGERDPSRVRVGKGSIYDPGTIRGPVNDVEATLRIALKEIAKQFDSLGGLQKRVLQRAIKVRGADVEAILRDVQFGQALEELRNPLTETQQEIRGINQHFQGLKRQARELGLATGLLDRAQRQAVESVRERVRAERQGLRDQVRAGVQQLRGRFGLLGGSDTQREIRGVVDQFRELRQQARELGMATGFLDRSQRQAVQAIRERAREEKRAAIQQQRDAITQQRATIGQQAVQAQQFFSGLLDPLRDFQSQMQFGAMSTLSPAAQFAEAQRQFRETATQAEAGDIEAIGRLPDIAQQLLEQAGQFGASPALMQAVTDITETFDRVASPLEREQERFQTLANIPKEFENTVQAQTAVLEGSLRDMYDELREIKRELRRTIRRAA